MRVFHHRTRGERGSGEGFPIVVPLMVYTRRAAPANSQPIPALQEQKWQSGWRKLSTQPVSIALPTNRGDAVLDRFYLPVDVVIPRCLRMRLEKGKEGHGREIFSQVRKYKSKFTIERKGKEFEVTLTQLAVELSVDDPFSKFKVEGTDDRGSGGALTPGTTCILVEVHEPSNPIPVLTAFLRVRMKLASLSINHIVGSQWDPQSVSSQAYFSLYNGSFAQTEIFDLVVAECVRARTGSIRRSRPTRSSFRAMIADSRPLLSEQRLGDVVKLGVPPPSQFRASASAKRLGSPIHIERTPSQVVVSASDTRSTDLLVPLLRLKLYPKLRDLVVQNSRHTRILPSLHHPSVLCRALTSSS